MIKYKVQTHFPALSQDFERLLPSLEEWIDVPVSTRDALISPELHQILQGTFPKLASETEEARLAMVCMNAFRFLAKDHLSKNPRGKMGPELQRISDSILKYLLGINKGAAWVAIRNAYGPEFENRAHGRTSDRAEFIQFCATNWMPIINVLFNYGRKSIPN
jgi:hypothetical protein